MREAQLRATIRAIVKDAEALETRARHIHNGPALFLDRDHTCMKLMSEAEGMKRAAYLMLEALPRRRASRGGGR